MAHLKHSETRAEATPREWLPIGTELAALAATWSRRDDIIAYVGPGAGGPAPACFNPALAEMEVNVDVACGEGVDPGWLRGISTNTRVQDEWAVLMGAVLHEASHARHSLWDIPGLHDTYPPVVADVTLALEETRIEQRALQHHPSMRAHLRACALRLVLGGDASFMTDRSAASLANLALLSLARVDAGVLDADDVATIRDIINEQLGTDLVSKMQGIWVRAQAVMSDTDVTPLAQLAIELVKLLEEAEIIPEGTSEGREAADDGTGTGTGTGIGTMLPDELVEALAEALAEAADLAEIEARGEIAENREHEERMSMAKDRAEAAREERSHADIAERLFSKGTGPSDGATRSRLSKERAPTGPERAAAVTIAQLLDRARYQERLVVPTSSLLPPGRLRSRAAVQAAAERSRGAMVTAEPWKGKHRRHVDDPTLQIGVMVDISGSMSAAEEPMGVTAWVFSEAARRIGARVAQVYYGNSVFAGLRPGEYRPDVRIYSAPDGTEHFDAAFKALDGATNLLHGSGARLLVIASDMCYTSDQENKAKEWIKRLTQAGVAVLIMGYGEMYAHESSGYVKLGVEICNERLNAADSALVVGRAAAAAIERASARRNVG